MSDAASVPNPPEEPQGCVIVGVIPDQPARVVREAARYAALLGSALVVVSVDVTRFVTAEDPDGYVHTAPIDVAVTGATEDLVDVEAAVGVALEGVDVVWTVRQLVGDPAIAMKQLAERTNARLLVVGTRRLAHRQHRPILVVPTDDPAHDDEELWPA
jgi:nucleotide-binding universal stress UspA family protein